MATRDAPLIVAIVGKKNSGKTTLLVGTAAELKRRGLRVASVKHGHHAFEIDHPGRDSWRHVHEGEVEAVLLLSSGKLAMVMQAPGEEPDVRAMIDRHFGDRGYDVVLVEGFKHGDLPKIEIHRRGVHERPVHDPADATAAGRFLAIVTDDPDLPALCPIIPLEEEDPSAGHVQRVADLVAELLERSPAHG